MLIDLLAYEYKWTKHDIYRLPLAEALCFQSAIYERREVKTGVPSFTERDILSSLQTEN